MVGVGLSLRAGEELLPGVLTECGRALQLEEQPSLRVLARLGELGLPDTSLKKPGARRRTSGPAPITRDAYTMGRKLKAQGLPGTEALAAMSPAERQFFLDAVSARVGEGTGPRLVRPSGGASAQAAHAIASTAPDASGGCFWSPLGETMPANTCIKNTSNGLWYQCDQGAWVDRWDDPTACSSVAGGSRYWAAARPAVLRRC